MILKSNRWGPSPHHQGQQRFVFLHGMGGLGQLWRPMAAFLEEEFEVLAPDQRGHGGSQIREGASLSPPTYTPLDYGQDVVDTLEDQSFYPTWILGHSMGVRTAVATAYLKPEWVQGLILIDLGFSGVAGGGLGETLAHFLRKLPLRFESRAALCTFLEAEAPDPAMGRYLMAVAASEGGQVYFPFDCGALIQTILAARDTSVRFWLEALVKERNLPVLALRGAESLVWTRDEYEKEKAFFVSFPSIQFEEVPGAGHGLPFEQRDFLLRRLRKFVYAATKS